MSGSRSSRRRYRRFQGWLAWAVFATAVLLLPPSLAAEVCQDRESRATGNAHLQGTVTDRSTRNPISNVEIRLHSPGDGTPLSRLTDERGRFFFSPVRSGRHELEFIHIGYRTVRDSVVIKPESDVRITAELVPTTITMKPLVVAVASRSRLESNGFFERRRTRTGTFITREEIEAQRPVHLSNLLQGVESLRLVRLPQGQGAAIVGRGGCRPIYFLDGIRLVDTPSLDLAIPPDHLEGVEIYGSSGVPAQYAGSLCGAIVMWSRQPAPGKAGSNFWLRAMLIALLGTGVYFATR